LKNFQPIDLFVFNELPRRKLRGIKNFKFCHSALDAESSPVFWIPASAGMTNSPQAAGNTTRRDLGKLYDIITRKRLLTLQKLVIYDAEKDEIKRTKRFISIPFRTDDKP
jgi:hypothetical protein